MVQYGNCRMIRPPRLRNNVSVAVFYVLRREFFTYFRNIFTISEKKFGIRSFFATRDQAELKVTANLTTMLYSTIWYIGTRLYLPNNKTT